MYVNVLYVIVINKCQAPTSESNMF